MELTHSSYGYLVDGVDTAPGQPVALQAGAAILEIGCRSLVGLNAGEIEEAFGAEFRDGVRLLLADAGEALRLDAGETAADDDGAEDEASRDRA